MPGDDEKTWLEVSLTVSAELAEAVADVLARYAPNGVVIESTAILPNPEHEGSPVGPLRVFAYLPVDDQLEDTRRKLEEGLFYLSRIWPENPLPPPQFKIIHETNWMEAWKQHYRPIPVGRRLLILPAWMDSPDPRRIAIRMDPGMAFGTGAHPTTQLCLHLLEDFLAGETFGSRLQAGPVIDVGCGSGILAIAALELGLPQALGVDIDPIAIPFARRMAELNGVSAQLELGVGSVDGVRAGHFSLTRAPLVFANILAPILVRLLEAGLGRLVEPGGIMILSGILAEQWDGEDSPLRAALERHHLRVVETRRISDWVAVAVSPA